MSSSSLGYFDLEFFHDIPALRIGQTLIVADLHLGYSVGMYRFSTRAKERYSMYQARSFLSLISTIRDRRLRRLVILGDLKEDIGFPKKYILRVLERLLVGLSQQFSRIYVVRGNHDGRLIDIVDHLGLDIYVVDHLTLKSPSGNVLLTHGHMKAPYNDFASAKLIVMGHIHPATDISKVFVTAEFSLRKSKKTLVVIPAANPILQGIPIDCNAIWNSLLRIAPQELHRDLKLETIKLLSRVLTETILCNKKEE